MSSSESTSPPPPQLAQAHPQAQAQSYNDCFSCAVIGSGALGSVGLYALNQSRPHQPGMRSPLARTAMMGLGFAFLGAGYWRWHNFATRQS